MSETRGFTKMRLQKAIHDAKKWIENTECMIDMKQKEITRLNDEVKRAAKEIKGLQSQLTHIENEEFAEKAARGAMMAPGEIE